MRFISNPVEIEAVQWDGTVAHASQIQGIFPEMSCVITSDSFSIGNKSGPQNVVKGDYIIKGTHGDYYPCPEAVFEAKYSAKRDHHTVGSVAAALQTLVEVCHAQQLRNGWWGDSENPQRLSANPLLFPAKLSLVHSEYSEALEAHRKSLPDSHLPQYRGDIVELIDGIVRTCDLLGKLQSEEPAHASPGEVLVEKLIYNDRRLDHKPAEREKAGGKKF